jgi:hypothetical protein
MLMLALVSHLALGATPTQLTIDVTPPGVEIKVDGKKIGLSGKQLVLKTQPGRHTVRLSFKGDSHEEEISLKAGEKKSFSWDFGGTGAGSPPTDEQPTLTE